MVGRILLVLVVAVLLELLGNIVLHRWQEPELISAPQIRMIAARLAKAEQTVLSTPRPERSHAMHELAIGGMTLNWVPRTVITDFTPSLPQLERLHEDIVRAEAGLGQRELRMTLMPSVAPGQRDLLGALRLSDGSFATFRFSPYLASPPRPGTVVMMHILLIVVVLGIAALMVRALVQPLRALAEAADATEQGRIGRFRIEGPPEIQRVATAFSEMQARLLKTMDDQTQALVAVSHDLRTPIQRLILRASLIEDTETSVAMAADLDEMEHFIEATLSYFRNGKDEEPRLVDVAAIAMTVADTAADLGADVHYLGADTLQARVRPLAFKRALSNLVDNACRHAARIEVTLQESAPDRFTIDVEDDGPGIPADKRGEAVLPFRRLDTSRGQQRGGAGLGLASATRALAVMGGSLTLGQSGLGGLKASVDLPRQ
ncbi:ATP-binding protein [Erythrobacter sp. SG61-1L]|uniref:ATP-binding protein n=1 Tax=Erythrobacter sp. SG61-1L TaxID=1603897 RepID=UPI0019D6BC0C|nr:ATP-binding protein [Erythrobacter sp. SG61-1L]